MACAHTFFDQLVFSGGGIRCLWQGGFMEVLRREIPIAPARIAGVSGGALTCCGFVTGRGTRIRDIMADVMSRQDNNVSLDDPVNGEPGNTPHQRTYREMVEQAIGDDEARDLIASGPGLEILIGRPPSGDWPSLSGAAMTALYQADTMLRSSPHLKWPEAAGMTGEMIDGNQAARDCRIVDLVCAAATIPPAFDPPLWDDRPAVDAGMVDQAPMPSPNAGRTLILLTKQFRAVPDHPDRMYVSPSKDVPASKIDFTDPDKLRATWQQGEDDARRFLADGRITPN